MGKKNKEKPDVNKKKKKKRSLFGPTSAQY